MEAIVLGMPVAAWVTLGIIVVVFVALVKNLAPPDMLFLGAGALLAALGIITVKQAFAGFSNTGMLTVAALFVVAAGLRDTGVMDYIGQRVLGGAKTEKGALARLGGVVLPMSAFLNNTPIVAMFMPMVIDWCRRHRVSPSKLLIPLSFLAVLGGTCTLIGTSTNLVVSGLMVDAGLPEMSLFEFTALGVPFALTGFLYLLFVGRRILPERKELLEQLGDSLREYLAEMQVQPGCRLIGQTVESAGLRQLPGLFLIEIDRNDQLIAPVNPDDVILANDRLVFTGIVSSIIDLEKIVGLVPVADPDYEVSPKAQRRRRLCEAVISSNSPLVGKSIKEAEFRATYGAAVVAVHRGGQRVKQKLGEVEMRPGDTLLLQVRTHFLRAHRNDPAFYLISDVEDYRPLRHDRAWTAMGLFLLLITLMTTGIMDELVAGTLVAMAMVGVGCISSGDARRSIDWETLVTIGASFGVGAALRESGAAAAIANSIVGATEAWGPAAGLIAIYVIGVFVTELITNNAAAVLVFPFCLQTAAQFHVDSRPFLIALVFAASAGFMTPIGYQTNMMVYGPGGYRFSDFVKIGAPMHLVLIVVAMTLIPVLWPFTPL